MNISLRFLEHRPERRLLLLLLFFIVARAHWVDRSKHSARFINRELTLPIFLLKTVSLHRFVLFMRSWFLVFRWNYPFYSLELAWFKISGLESASVWIFERLGPVALLNVDVFFPEEITHSFWNLVLRESRPWEQHFLVMDCLLSRRRILVCLVGVDRIGGTFRWFGKRTTSTSRSAFITHSSIVMGAASRMSETSELTPRYHASCMS